MTGQGVVLRRAYQIHLRPQFVARALQADLRVLHLEPGLPQVRPIRESQRYQILQRAGLIVTGNFDGIGGDDARVQHIGIVIGTARDHVLDDRFLLFEQAARVDQILANGINLRVGPRQLDRRLRALIHFRFGVGVEFLGRRQRLFLHFHVFIERHQIGIEAHHAIHGGDELLLHQ